MSVYKYSNNSLKFCQIFTDFYPILPIFTGFADFCQYLPILTYPRYFQKDIIGIGWN